VKDFEALLTLHPGVDASATSGKKEGPDRSQNDEPNLNEQPTAAMRQAFEKGYNK